jgi:hypothetical protein
MRCNKCGGDNPDDRRFCQVCGHKLQSGRAEDAAAPDSAAPEGGRSAARPAAPGSEARGGAEAASADREAGHGQPRPQNPELAPEKPRPDARLLDFQGWKNPLFGLGPYFEACLYAGVLAVAVAACLAVGVLWPLYPLLAVLALVAWLRRL